MPAAAPPPKRDVEVEWEKPVALSTTVLNKVRIGKDSFLVVFHIDPNKASSLDDRFVLVSEDGTEYRETLTVKDDLVKDDALTTLLFKDLKPGLRYRLEWWPDAKSAQINLFRNATYEQLMARQVGDLKDVQDVDDEPPIEVTPDEEEPPYTLEDEDGEE